LFLLQWLVFFIGNIIENTFNSFSASRDVAILVMHHVKEETVSSMYRTQHQIGANYKELGGIFDMVFLEDRGIYECDFNAETLQTLSSVIMRYARRH